MRRLPAVATVLVLAGGLASPAAAEPGGEASDDTQAPVITIAPPAGGVDGWHPATVQVRVLVSDSHTGATGVSRGSYVLSGATTGSGTLGAGNTATITLSNEGSTTITVDAWDRADNHARAVTLVGVDRRAPVVTIGPGAQDGDVYARGQVVPFTFSCADDFVGVASCTGEIANGDHVDTSTVGRANVLVTAVDRVGNRRVGGIAYTVVEPYLVPQQAPRVDGDPVVDGAPLVAVGPATSPAASSVTFQWRRDGVAIPGADGSLYRPVAADAGRAITVAATASRPWFESVTLVSPPVTVRPGTLVATGAARVSGTARVGSTLSLTTPSYGPGTTVTHQWLRDGRPIAGATARSYRLTAADAGRRVSATVAARRTGYATASVTSPATAVVARAVPKVTGHAVALGGGKVRITVRVAATGVTPTGSVVVKRGATTGVVRIALRDGKGTAVVSRQPRTRVTYGLTYAATAGVGAGSGRVAVTVR